MFVLEDLLLEFPGPTDRSLCAIGTMESAASGNMQEAFVTKLGVQVMRDETPVVDDTATRWRPLMHSLPTMTLVIVALLMFFSFIFNVLILFPSTPFMSVQSAPVAFANATGIDGQWGLFHTIEILEAHNMPFLVTAVYVLSVVWPNVSLNIGASTSPATAPMTSLTGAIKPFTMGFIIPGSISETGSAPARVATWVSKRTRSPSKGRGTQGAGRGRADEGREAEAEVEAATAAARGSSGGSASSGASSPTGGERRGGDGWPLDAWPLGSALLLFGADEWPLGCPLLLSWSTEWGSRPPVPAPPVPQPPLVPPPPPLVPPRAGVTAGS